jgi:ATP synthase mitochondrial F1 complex assembly factor 1
MATAARSHPQFILPLPRQIAAAATSSTSSNSDSRAETETETETAAEIHFLQWGFYPPATAAPGTLAPTVSSNTANTHTSTIVFTHLLAYKTHGSYAQPHTTITHHLDLADSTGLVLMHGHVMPDRGVGVAEASWLVSCVQRFYDFSSSSKSTSDGNDRDGNRKAALLKMFTRGDVEGFSVEDLVEEAERFS